MKQLINFLGQCHNPYAIRAQKLDDRIEILLDNSCYSYSLDSDKEEIAMHALKLHTLNQGKVNVDEDAIYSVREQLGLKPKLAEEIPGTIDLKPAKKVKKKASKKVTKKVSKKNKK